MAEDSKVASAMLEIGLNAIGSANEDHIRKVQADSYVTKFEINELLAVSQEVL